MTIEEFLKKELEAWAVQFIQDRRAFLRRRKIRASGELDRSLETEVLGQAQREAVELLLAFEEHGRYIDMRRMQPPAGGGDYIFLLQQWIKKRGFEKEFIEKYMRRRKLRKVPRDVLNRIAWGIAVKRSNGRYRRRRWYNKPKSARITGLFNQVAANLPEIVADNITDQFKAS